MQTNRNNVFISSPITLDWGTFMEFVRSVVKTVPNGSEVHFWDRQEEYDQEKFDSCNTVIFLLPDNKFEASFGELPVGLRAELRRAYVQSKNILIGYKADNGKGFYDTHTNGQYIKGIRGTAGALDRIIEKTEKAKDELQNLSWIGKRVKGFEESSSVTYLRRLGEIGKVLVYDPSEDSICVEFLDGTTLWYSAEKAKKYIVESRTDDVKRLMRMVNNCTYGIYVPNPCAEVKLPKGPIGSVGHKGTPGVDGIEFDERLLLML